MNINNLTIEEKIGQMLCFAHQGTDYHLQLKTLIEDYHIGNIIHFAHNITSIEQLKTLNQTIQNKSKYPVFISLDQEGGMVRRITDQITYLPGAMSLAATGENIYKITKLCAEDLKQLGICINYAPVADINTNPNNPVINSRSFGDEINEVSKLVNQAFKAIQDAFVLPTVKHFPGHGDTNVDSHLGLPVVDKTKNELLQGELVPYLQAISNGLEGIMVAHILYTELDENYPSTLSYNIITKLLKEELGFKGLITTDSLTMKAIWGRYSIKEIVKRGILAGNDILVFCGGLGLEDQKNIYQTFLELVCNNEIQLKRIDESVEKIINLKNKYCSKPKIKNLSRGNKLAQSLIDKSITKVYDEELLPLKEEDKVLVIFPKIHLASLVDNENNQYETLGKFLGCEEIIIDNLMNNYENIIQNQAKYDKIILATYNVSAHDYASILYGQLDKEKIIHVALRSPYDLRYIKNTKTAICTYDCTKETLRSLSIKLKTNKFSGTLPVKI